MWSRDTNINNHIEVVVKIKCSTHELKMFFFAKANSRF